MLFHFSYSCGHILRYSVCRGRQLCNRIQLRVSLAYICRLFSWLVPQFSPQLIRWPLVLYTFICLSWKILFLNAVCVYKGFRLSFVSRLSLRHRSRCFHRVRKSSSGDSVDSLIMSGAIYTTVIVSDWCIMNLAHCWWVSIQNIVGIM